MATRWGILSAGKISHDFTVGLSTLPKSEHTVVAVAAKDLSRAQQFGKLHGIPTQYGSYQKLAEDKNIDVVYIGSLNTTHLQDAKLMLDHGKNVICEKPLTLNLKQTKELLDYAKSKNLFLMEAVWSRCNPIYEEAKKRIAQGVIGDVYQIICTFGFAMPHVDRLMKKSMGGGTILDLGIYPLQFVSYIFDEEKPVAVKAAGHLNSDGVDESMSATLIYKNGRTATIATHAQVNLPNEAQIIGTKGVIKIPTFWAPTRAEFPDGSVFEKPVPVSKIAPNFVNSGWLSCEAAEVRQCLQKGLKESTKVPHKVSLLLAELEDELRRQLGVVYDVD